MKVDVLGVQIDALPKNELLKQIEKSLLANRQIFLTTPYSESLVAAQRDDEFRRMLNSSDFVLPDGVGVLWAANYLNRGGKYGFLRELWALAASLGALIFRPGRIRMPIPEKISGSELIRDLSEMAERNGWSVFLLGGFGDTGAAAARTLQTNFPRLKLAGTYAGSPAEAGTVRRVNESGADFLFVAYGPRAQEEWIVKNRGNLSSKLLIGVGGTFDYLAGKRPYRPKKWALRGLEWLWRLLTQPWRAGRIFRGVFGLIYYAFRAKLEGEIEARGSAPRLCANHEHPSVLVFCKIFRYNSGMKVKVRFAPSPTGFLHIGGLRTALFNFLFARKNQGGFALRIEDTDRNRTVKGATENIIETLRLFHLDFDEGPVYQSARLDLYRDYAQMLLQSGSAYRCYCSQERIDELKKQAEAAKLPFRYDKHCLFHPDQSGPSYVIRQNVPEEGTTEFEDLVHGKISVENRRLDDGVLVKSDGYPVYNFANVIDDHLMEITHVIRGEEFIPSTPKHILLYRSLGWEPPLFAHLPLILDTNRKKLSKRLGEVAVKEYMQKGYLPEALLNFIALLGWNPKTKKELFTLAELTSEFSLDKINRAGAVFDTAKLNWFNNHYVQQKKPSELLALVKTHFAVPVDQYPENFLKKIVEIEQSRLNVLSEIGERTRYFFAEPEYEPKLLGWKQMTGSEIKKSLEVSEQLIKSATNHAKQQELQDDFFAKIGTGDKGAILWPLRVALTGQKATPGPFEIMAAFFELPNGREILLRRIRTAIARL